MADTIKIKQVRSTNGCKQDQVRTVRALGLHRIREVREIADNESVRGMIFKVKHLVEIVEEKQMQLHDLTPAPGSTKNRKRVGRGNSSGHGTTSGRGQKGQGSRSGGTKGAGFEGGQTPLAMRLPKLPGFRNPRRIEYTAVNVERLERKFEDGAVIDGAALKAARITKSEFEPVKVLGNGELTKKFTVKVDKVSASAQAKIEAAGGKVELPC